MLNAKLRKLVRDPNLFLSDMIKNKKRKIGKYQLKKEEGHYSYALVTAVYNVGRYLDDYFKSLVAQKLDFEKHIKLIMVDDGSTDDSAMIIKKWARKYPDNIVYVWKENGGQSSARNIGLEYVTSDWVTFVDPDDFLDHNYFYNIDCFIYKNKSNNLSILGCNVVFYFEKNDFYKETHPLGFKFKNGDICMPVENMGKNIQLSASTAIFKSSLVRDNNIKFDPEVKPAFEDAKFVQEYLLDVGDSSIGFLRDSKYYYRKREDGTSTLDTAWQKVERFTTTPKYGYLKIIEKCYSIYGYVPEYIQRTLIYEISWHLKWLLNHQERASFLTDDQKEEYINNLREVFKHIDKKTIINFELSGCWFFHKVGLISFFKSEDPDAQIVYIEKYDSYKGLVQLRYFAREIGFEHFTVDGKDAIPAYAKNISHEFLGRNLVTERRLWFFVGNSNKIDFKISNLPTRLSLAGKQSTSGVSVTDVRNHFSSTIPQYKKVHKYIDSWLLMDRDTQADDNAEHLYRYIKNNQPEQKIFFVLRRDSHDWARLENDGFNLIEFSSNEHELALKSCAKIISSHADKYVTNYLGPKMLEGRHYVFLQHGVTKDNISNWLNQKENIDCLVTASPYEYQSMIENGTRYYYNEKEVVLTGFPRHDKLVENIHNNERLIIIMPTWRNSIVGSTLSEGNIRQLNPDFMETKFAIFWNNLLHSDKLKILSEQYGFSVAFFPHANIQPYLSEFNTPEYINIISHTDGSIQNIFNRAAMMITDYSSVAFEMAVQNKQTLYYQFDADEIYSGGHFYSKGYFDYRENGFGPVVYDEESLLQELEYILENDAIPSGEILERINNTFPYRDGNNCKRVYDSICALDLPLPLDHDNSLLIKDFAKKSSDYNKWSLAEDRWSRFLTLRAQVDVEPNIDTESTLRLVEALTEQGKVNQAVDILDMILNDDPELCNDVFIIECQALVRMARHQWQAAIVCWDRLNKNTLHNKKYCICLAFVKDSHRLNNLITEEGEQSTFTQLCSYMASEQWDEMVRDDYVESFTSNTEVHNTPESLLLLAYAYNKLSYVDAAHSMLVKYESIIKNDPKCRYEIARLAFSTQNWGKLVKQLNINCPDVISLPVEFLEYYLIALTYQGKHQLVDGYLTTLCDSYGHNSDDIAKLFVISSICAIELKQWAVAESRLEKCITSLVNFDEICYSLLAEVLIKLGKLDRAEYLLSVALSINDKNTSAFRVRALLNMLIHNWDNALSDWNRVGDISENDNNQYLLCLAFSKQTDKLEQLLEDGYNSTYFINLLIQFSESKWINFIEDYTGSKNSGFIEPNEIPIIYILLSYSSRKLNKYDDAHNYLVKYEGLIKNDPQCRYEIAEIAFAKNNWKKCIQQLKLTGFDPLWLPDNLKVVYLEAMTELGLSNDVEDMLNNIIAVNFDKGCELLRLLSFISYSKRQWSIAELRFRKYCSLNDDLFTVEAQKYILSLINQGNLGEAEKSLEYFSKQDGFSAAMEIAESRALLNMSKHNWNIAVADWNESGGISGENLFYCQCLYQIGSSDTLLNIFNNNSECLPEYNKKIILSYYFASTKKWQSLVKTLNDTNTIDLVSEQSLDLGLLLLLSRGYRELNCFNDAHKCLVVFESKIRGDIQCRYEIARLSIARGEWHKALTQLNMISSDLEKLPVEFKYYYLFALFNMGSYHLMDNAFNSISFNNNSFNFDELRLKMFMKLERWNDALKIIHMLEINDDNIYNQAMILRGLGEFKSAFTCLANYRFIDTIEYWTLRGDLAQLNDDWEEFYKCTLRIRGKKSGEMSIQGSDIDNLVNLRIIQSKK